MPHESLEVRPSEKKPREVIAGDGKFLPVPDDWDLLLPGDAALSRRIKKDGPSWTMIEMKGRKKFSRGIWAPAHRIAALESELKTERENPAYQKKLDAGRVRREKEQVAYVDEFHTAVLTFLAFTKSHRELAAKMASAITAHAVPVGSGTVARTKRIPVERRAEAAVIAWMRHQTTAYDDMTIPREKGARRDVRRMLAARSRQLLERYRTSDDGSLQDCPLRKALAE